jgi:2-polyprenyl-3-methyl-5-hydroxy-6-metoxy-1,4-benzoquinol methylase
MQTPTTIRGLVQAARYRTGRYYRDPRSYWNTRHEEHRDSLLGPGCIRLDEAANRDDYAAKWDRVRAVLARELQHGATRLLDAGCGTGWFTARAAALGFDGVDAADFSSTAAEVAQRNAPTSRVRVAALDEITSPEPYDVVMCVDVLFHVVDDAVWARSVSNLAALTARRGALVIQDSLNETGAPPPARHVCFRSLAAYRETLPGWDVDKHETYVLPQEAERKDLLVFRRSAT